MLLNFKEIIAKYNIEVRGVLHIGAHFGQELDLYEECNIKNIMFFEPVPATFKVLKNNINDRAIAVNTALGNIEGEIEMYIETANQGQSSSVLEPEFHLKQYSSITFSNKIKVPINRLDNYIDQKNQYNVLNVDVQGYELEVFKGGTSFLNYIDAIITEVNRAELYKGCAQIDDIDSFLKQYNFTRVETNWAGETWGDALYIK